VQGVKDSKSKPLQGYVPAIPDTHGVCAVTPVNVIAKNKSKKFLIKSSFSLNIRNACFYVKVVDFS
jgi:hypothetical protein